MQHFTSPENRHALPLFTSLLNVVCAYDPVGLGLPYNHLLFTDSREPLVETALQLLIVTLDWDSACSHPSIADEVSIINIVSLHYKKQIMENFNIYKLAKWYDP